MSWMSQIYKTYEENVGKGQNPDEQMTPVAHMNANAQIEVTLSWRGEFLGAVKVEKEDAVTLIPVTEASAGRSSGKTPHALCDTLSYVGGDYCHYCENEKERKSAEAKYKLYMEALKKWRESKYSHPKVETVHQYLLRKELIRDLVKAGVVELKEDGTFQNKKLSGKPYEKALVRFRVLSTEKEADGTWQDASLIQAYTEYYFANQDGKRDICYFLGQESAISQNHPKGIVAANYGAKLITANDKQGYTYRGRFQDEEQALAFSYEASQKIHSALTWLAKQHGAYAGTQDKRLFICWNPEGKKVPSIFGDLGLTGDDSVEAEEPNYRKKLIKTFQGYRNQFDESDSVVIMGLDAATTGRLSVTYYYQLMASDFFDRITYWGETCNWLLLKFDGQNHPYYGIETPTFERIVKCAFGRERDSSHGKSRFIEIGDKLLKEQIQRLVKCMVEKRPVPYDLVQALAVRASTPMAYTRGNRERVLSTACAIIRKYYYERETEKKGEEEYMKLNLENHDRSYLFGRLLAVLEKVERLTYDRDEKREPNAIRLQSAYVNHPMQTWKVLTDQLNPYLQKLHPEARKKYKDMITDIVTALEEKDEQQLNRGLEETYLIGYYLQRAELNKRVDIKTGKQNTNDHEEAGENEHLTE
ncbi:type I-C CRISPR-associated protein Cas8c/Csd1 [Eubacterium sp. am_0171]|uniref:CRISPR-associated protein Cas8c/Csd1, subtype I-C/DVULG n=2 Tax=Clostridia TaxID=186801 RepID=A0A174AE91_9FIRM|nr:type I-C CRISPR-associated protein Cas8c/Csd1 [Faecalicatena contorta]MSC83626.1 type I-C CRISPR-associated protein Cas8c/Csd1 [Eubacterium sp. BIOML-A1]MSD04663.1 type I-C CRISPR-associated protein Cas8c/Csd1 [Eubacterium sp. BIOML-A2]RYT25840.1 type I-C CRISPR-associated protein Cas8c/Csd1 [Eubacterium sp. am_0171]CUN86219.1 CRISPR-associated protein Cas8c/Csd1%2C subtype I-C/DVULG [[Eubacterium] contortum] [Faecalicatena contorta]